MPLHWYGFVAAVASGLVQLALFLRWLHRRMRDDEIVHAFVRDLAVTHLPHIYSALRQIAGQKGISVGEAPLVHFVDFSGHRRRR
jgi:hypothetical protein